MTETERRPECPASRTCARADDGAAIGGVR